MKKLCIVLPFLLFGCQSKEKQELGLASVGEEVISEELFQYWWKEKRGSISKEDLLEQLIEREAMVQRALNEGLDQDPEIQEQIRSLLVARLKEKELHKESSVDEAILKGMYNESQTRFVEPAQKKVAVLWFQTRGLAPLEMQYRNRLSALRTKVEDIPLDQGFGQLSTKNSEHQSSRYRGGVIPWLEPGQQYDPWRAAVLEIASELNPGDTSEVIIRPEGAFLVRLLKVTDSSIKSFDSVRLILAKEYRNTQRLELAEQFRSQTLAQFKIARRSERLEQLNLTFEK